ncbi:DUF2382 domain-containing protein [Streptomyces sp. CMB-StM0423]|uniref:DUF2382 domain-containing protein n=1 Tax=Streptomyces sp. CMB-StM0423 TaxID=2059884 RepID=UPI000C6FDEE9|nr:DUF2382 domain-containing protein [Streptomyces sp. CMB-StM0423]AUH43319.1 hypothetical protein CXR04_26990 [Streptomyces sp. CMB-StM0423]
MQTDRNTASGGSGKAAEAAGVGRETDAAAAAGGGGQGEQSRRGQQPENARRGGAAEDQRVVAYRERLQVEPVDQRQPVGEAEVTIRVRETPQRFEVTRGHDECVVRRSDVDGKDGNLIAGDHHEFVERSVKVPLYGEDAEVVVHKVSEPYAVADIGTRRIEDTQTFETVLKTEEIVENVPAGSGSSMSVREVQEGYDLREGARRQQQEERKSTSGHAAAPETADTPGAAEDIGEGKGRGRWF